VTSRVDCCNKGLTQLLFIDLHIVTLRYVMLPLT